MIVGAHDPIVVVVLMAAEAVSPWLQRFVGMCEADKNSTSSKVRRWPEFDSASFSLGDIGKDFSNIWLELAIAAPTADWWTSRMTSYKKIIILVMQKCPIGLNFSI